MATNEEILNPQQKKAVDAVIGQSTIVTAAAGSGKTFVLVERIIRLISTKDNNIPADSLAIMTFTKNATRSLHEKLNKALDKEMMKADLSEEDRAYLEEQKFRLRQANISTIDAFCLRLIKDNPEAFGLPVTFSIADSTKKAAMQTKAIELTMQTFYSATPENSEYSFTKQERNALFYTFNFRNDDVLQQQVISFAEELSTYVDAEKWLDEAEKVYTDEATLENQYLKPFKDLIRAQLNIAKALLAMYPRIAADLSVEADDLLAEANDQFDNASTAKIKASAQKKVQSAETLVNEIIPAIDEYISLDADRFSELEKACSLFAAKPSIKTLGEFYEVLNSIEPMPSISQKGSRAPSRSKFTAIKNRIQDTITELKNASFDYQTLDITAQRSLVASFIKLVRIYRANFDFIKKNAGCIDFSDCELLLLKKLSEDEDYCKQLSERFSCMIVDEFQDSNDIQAEIFKKIALGKLFCVGDIKQSIYAFRGGNPKIMAALCKKEDGFVPLPLGTNYRSRKTIIEFVNKAFTGLMTEEYGGVDYYSDDEILDNSLHFGATLYPAVPEEYRNKYLAEIHLLNSQNAGDNKEFVQARFVAQRIKELHDDENFKVTAEVIREVEENGKTVLKKVKELVRPNYSDFLILTRKKTNFPYYRQALAELGITSSAPRGSGFLESEEIKLVLNFLAVVDNPLKDEELLKVLMSPIYRFTANEVAELRLGLTGLDESALSGVQKSKLSRQLKKYSLFNCLKLCAQPLSLGDFIDGESTVLERNVSPKITRFLADLEGFRYYMNSNSLYRLVCKIYEDTDAELIVAAFENSSAHVANIRRLQDMAADFEARDGGSLGDFLRFINRVKLNQSQKIEDASLPEDSANSVQIMTFHASKGLEAPVCIMSELDYTVSKDDYSGTMINDRDNYLALNTVDIKKRVKSKSFARRALELIIKKRARSEELRLLYVALTRAKDKLIMVSEGKMKDWSEPVFNPELPQEVFGKATPFKWIFSSLLRYPHSGDDTSFAIDGVCIATEDSFTGQPPQPIDEKNEEIEADKADISALSDKINFRYAHEEDTTRREKYSVTELAHRNSTMPINLNSPSFAADFEKVSGADKGNAYHNCMQYISFEKFRSANTEDYVGLAEGEIERLTRQHKLTAKDADIIEPEKIAEFFSGEFGKRLLRASEIRREEPFFAEVSGAEIGEDDLGRFMLQGRVDLYFIEDGEIVVVDYKSDNLYNLEKEKENYAKQVKIYSSILPRLTGLKVKEIYLYVFANGEALRIQ